MTPPGGHSLQKSNTVNSYSNNNPKQHHSKSNKVVMVNGTAGEESCTSSVQNKKMIKAVKSSPAKQELDALAKVLEFQVSYKTFPTKATSSDVVTLVTLKTNPPKVRSLSGRGRKGCHKNDPKVTMRVTFETNLPEIRSH